MDGSDWTDLILATTTAAGPELIERCTAVLRRADLELVDLFVADHQRRTLRSLRTGTVEEDPELLAVAFGGRPLERGELWVWPLRCRGRRVGALALRPLDHRQRHELAGELAGVSRLLAAGLEAAGEGDDDVSTARRRQQMSLPAELQWTLLPAPEYIDDRVRVSGAVEPAYDTGGDVFDYGRSGDLLHVCVMDAMGHGMSAALVSALATSAWRQARRREEDLVSRAASIHRALVAEFGHRTYVAAILGEIDLAAGSFRWVNAGHLPPLVWGDGHLEVLDTEPVIPLGLDLGDGHPGVELHHRPLDRGERVVLHTDGTVDNLGADGEPVGADRFRELLRTSLDDASSPVEARDAVDELLRLAPGPLRDDATLLIAERR